MKSILITGSAARVGRAFAIGLAKDGWSVAVHYNRSDDKAEQLVREIQKDGGQAVTIGGNLNIPDDLHTLILRAAEKLGHPLTALINNASTFDPDSVAGFTPALFDHHVDINLKAPLILAQHFAKQLPKKGSGSIINIIDQRVLKPNPLYFTYSMSKSALYWSTKTMAQALAPRIRVNAIGPGPTLQNTAQTERDFAHEAANTLLEHGSSPDTLLHAVRYLLDATSVTGQMLAVDSGQHLNWKTQDLLSG